MTIVMMNRPEGHVMAGPIAPTITMTAISAMKTTDSSRCRPLITAAYLFFGQRAQDLRAGSDPPRLPLPPQHGGEDGAHGQVHGHAVLLVPGFTVSYSGLGVTT